MLFTKIRETIGAFTAPQRTPSKEEQMEAYERSVREASSGVKKLKATVRIGVYIAVLIPTAMLLSQILHQVTHYKDESLGTLGIIVGFLIAWAIGAIHREVLDRIPFHKFNPFFGNKIEETIRAFKTKNQLSTKHS